MERVCFPGRIRPDRIDEYRSRHAEVWPEMTVALREAGWTSYSLFLAADGLLVGHLETDDYQAALERMAQISVNARWQADMEPLIADLSSQRPDEAFRRIAEIFHLD